MGKRYLYRDPPKIKLNELEDVRREMARVYREAQAGMIDASNGRLAYISWYWKADRGHGNRKAAFTNGKDLTEMNILRRVEMLEAAVGRTNDGGFTRLLY